MLLDWFRTGHLDALVKDLVADFARQYPPSLQADSRPATKKRLASAVLALDRKIAQFRSQHALGMFKKAKVANGIKWGLKEQGYAEKLVDDITKHVVIRLSGS